MLLHCTTATATMRPSSLLRTFSSKLSACKQAPSPVVPWPPLRTPFDQWLTAELDDLRLGPGDAHSRCTTAAWLFRAADLAVAAQGRAAELVRSTDAGSRGLGPEDRRAVDDCLDDVIELLDACNGVRERMEAVRTYAGALSLAARYLERGEASETVARRARAALDSCEAMERRSAELEKCGSNLRKLGEKLAASAPPPPPRDDASSAATELHEALSGCRALALLAVAMLGIALSFKTRRGLPAVAQSPSFKGAASWGAALHELHREVKEVFDKRRRDGFMVMDEMEAAVSAARSLRDVVASRHDRRELRAAAAAARKRCGELEDRVRPCGDKVGELCRQLISVRVALLGKLTEA